MRKLQMVFSFCIAASAVMAQSTDSAMFKRIADDVFTNSTGYENLRILCKKVGPRLSGSPQAAAAVQETYKMMKAMGADTVYLQECMVPHWVRGAKESALLVDAKGKTFSLNICALGNSVGTGKQGIKAEVIEVRSFKELEQLGVAGVKGKIVFYNFPMNPTNVETFRSYGEAGQFRGRGPSMAAKYGAVGAMVRSLASNIDDYPHTGTTTYNDSFPKIPAIAVSTRHAEYISAELKKNKTMQLYFRTECEMLPDVKSHNVIAEIRGTELPNEVITVGGHLDSWDLAEGAHDDGAGCIQSMEIIRVYKKLGIKPKRTIRVVMFMNEENGLRGGRKYAEVAATEKDKKFIFALESDAGGFTPRAFGFTAEAPVLTKLRNWAPLFKPYGVYEFADGGGGADIGPLRPLGTTLSGLRPDSQRYFDHHHAANDTFEMVSKRELELGAINMVLLLYVVDQYGL
ncbi:peptidase M28 family protein [Lacibacter luteus]|uniref:Carboxypeptidase Q n=1 Tax=Lacibacter luteus TaxID=2508719 RepID=A0A4Q1CGK5_9BACT|nr:M20/M25/M40 family metallo-hydrolase [Lacibacter luteus]RXK59290.1 peptidase M28 family protein [Lacibacter luteus]